MGWGKLAFYRPSNRVVPSSWLALNWVRQVVAVTVDLELWFNKGASSGEPISGVAIQAVSYGITNPLGKELVDNGYISCRKTGVGDYIGLNSVYWIGNMEVNPTSDPLLAETYNNPYLLTLRLLVPVGASSVGPVLFCIQETVQGIGSSRARLIGHRGLNPSIWIEESFNNIPLAFVNRYLIGGRMQNLNALDRTGLALVCRAFIFDAAMAEEYSMFSFPA